MKSSMKLSIKKGKASSTMEQLDNDENTIKKTLIQIQMDFQN